MSSQESERAALPARGGMAPASRIVRAFLEPSFIAFLLCSLALALVFALSPELDLDFQALFYRGGEGFFLKDSFFAGAFYRLIPVLTWVAGAVLLALLVAGLFRAVRSRGLDPRIPAVLLLTLVIGPGLVVNALFKDNWGRARPSQIVEFGGDKRFTPAFAISDQCERNCAFVAGHPSVLFALFAGALMLRRRRRAAVATIAVLGALAGLGRIMQGGHFLSDVIFSGVFTYFVAWAVVHAVMPPAPRAAPSGKT